MKFERQPSAEFLDEARQRLKKDIGKRATDYFDTHHCANYAAEWNARAESKALRATMLAPNLWRGAHNLLHAMCPPVPVPSYQTLQYVLPRFNYDQSPLQKIDQYCILVDQRRNHPRMKPIERQVNDLSIEAMQMQKVFIQQGTLNDKRRIIT